jgi:hypothetical protein
MTSAELTYQKWPCPGHTGEQKCEPAISGKPKSVRKK